MGKNELFEGLFIEDKWDLEPDEPCDKDFCSAIFLIKRKDCIGLLLTVWMRVAAKYNVLLKETVNSAKLKELIEALSTKLGKVVVLIDEYDKPIIDYLGTDTAKAIENREILKSFIHSLKMLTRT